MPVLVVDKVYYVAHRDLIVLTGHAESGAVFAGMEIDLPVSIRGPGFVPIVDVQHIPFRDGTLRFGVVVNYESVTSAPFMEFRDLEGLTLDIRGAD
jgi:hypothetical protein